MKESLSDGAIAGMSVGAFLLLLVIIVVTVCMVYKEKCMTWWNKLLGSSGREEVNDNNEKTIRVAMDRRRASDEYESVFNQ